LDCDADALVVLVMADGPACHTGAESCFHNELQDAGPFESAPAMSSSNLAEVLADLYSLIESRKRERPVGSYTSYLFDQGLDKILKKVGEESAETIIAAKNDDREALLKETSDLLYHLVVLMVERELSLEEVGAELVSRSKK
jgi:phosphoribosyl-ATP pyrophosphohydrolase/phosphoribosyl-AMP cyclohydrolase